MIDSTSKVDQIITRLRLLISERQFAGDKLPSEPELAEQFGTSRATLRQALALLEMEGLLARKHGTGTFINRQILNIPNRLEEVWDFVEMIRLAGFTPGVRHVSLALEPVSPEVAIKLELPPAAEVLSTGNIFLADDVPVIYCIDIIPANSVQQAYRDEELHGPVYPFLEKRCGQQLDYNIAKLLPAVADTRLSQLLECPPQTPLHYMKETGFNAAGTPLIYSEEYYRPEYFSFHVRRKMTTAYKK